VELANDLGEYAKLIALVLAILGFAAVYFPGIRRKWERTVTPSSWYWIGRIDRDGRFVANSYQHPLWNSGPMPADRLNQIIDQVLITERGKDAEPDTHVGREQPTGSSTAEAVFTENVCLYVRELTFRQDPAKSVRYVWVRARKVTC
jgi:hypothetical protein